jgi:arylsulfatase A-like enzyme
MPERYAMFTGRLPCTRRRADADHKPMVSLGNQARKGGYDTAFFGKWHIQSQTFDREDVAQTGFDVNEGGRDVEMTDDAIAFLSQTRKKPFLAVVSYYNPHDICEWGRKKAGRTEGIHLRNGEVDINPSLEVCPPLPRNFAINPDEAEAVEVRRSLADKGVPNAQKMAMDFSPDDWRQYRWAYHRLVELVDVQISRVLQALKDQELDENTVVIFTSDHGDGYGAHRWHQKSVLYEESCRVPFIIRWPGAARKNETEDRLISVGIDLMATVSDIVGVAMPSGPYYGTSALPFVFDADSKAPTHAFVVTEAEVRIDEGVDYQGRSLRTPGFKYHVWSRGDHREQLFDMAKDPGETRNLAETVEYAAQLQRHRGLLADWLRRTDDSYEAKE